MIAVLFLGTGTKCVQVVQENQEGALCRYVWNNQLLVKVKDTLHSDLLLYIIHSIQYSLPGVLGSPCRISSQIQDFLRSRWISALFAIDFIELKISAIVPNSW